MAKQKIDLKKFIPSNLRNELNTSLAANLFNRFLSEEQSVFVNGQVGNIADPTAAKIHSDTDRELNALIPALYLKTGSEEKVYTFDDMLNRMSALGVDINNLRSSLAEQSLNFAPPINLDKFINYSNYYWTASDSLAARAPGAMPWNSELLPEYYVIARPDATSTVKLPVTLATTTNIKLYGKNREPETVSILFSDATNFSIVGSNGPIQIANAEAVTAVGTTASIVGTKTTFMVSVPGVADAASANLFLFEMTRGSVDFEAGDRFDISITYVTGSNTISFTAGPSHVTLNKGYISNVVPDHALMLIDGRRVRLGDTILVKNQNLASENGVYIVKADKWERAPLFDSAEHFPIGTQIYVLLGFTQYGLTFEQNSVVNTLGLDPLTFIQVPGRPHLQVNDWQVHNYWVHKDDLVDAPNAVQATRPIIEYDFDLQMNCAFDSEGNPSDVGTTLYQSKRRFNQIPQFDLFLYDGHHARKTSGIFFYEEDPDYPVDSVLKRRVKTTFNSDFVFGLGVKDEDDRLLFFKKNNQLKTVWAPGVMAPKASSVKFIGEAGDSKGGVTINSLIPTTDNQTWTLTAITPTTFSVVGTRSGNIGVATVDVRFDNPSNFALTITNGTTAFAVGDTFSFSIANRVAPRYVTQVDGALVNVQSGSKGYVNSPGTWLVPRRMFENLERELLTEIPYGDMIDHFRSIMKAQDGFEGSSFGVNNYRNLHHDLGLGGNIREHNANFPLLASMLMQPGMSPLSIIDFGEQQYAAGLASVDQFLADELASYIAIKQIPAIASIDPTDSKVLELLSRFEDLRGKNQMLRDVFSDSTALVKNWPITIPMMGLTKAVVPTYKFDNELGIMVLVHHDGHVSPAAEVDDEFNRNLVRATVLRSDNTASPGVFSETAPLTPYARQLWFKPSTNSVMAFNVKYDTVETPSGEAGDFWYRRASNELREWDEHSRSWVISSASHASRWIPINTANIRNSLILALEAKLYQSVHPKVRQISLATYYTSPLVAIELAKFSAKYGYDTYAPVFDQADAFTWNYKTSLGKARWFDVYYEYFAQNGMLPTCRPNLEPWKLMGFESKPATWDAQYADTTGTRMWSPLMWSDIMMAHPGVKLCVNINTDELLPPYVSSQLPESSQALLTTMPAGISNTYEFRDNGPVEHIWKKSLEMNYGMARVYFKLQPLRFLYNTWGATYIYTAANEIRLERNLMQPHAPAQFLLHGERLHNIIERDAQKHFIVNGNVSASGTATVKFEVSHVENNATYFNAYVNDVLQGIIEEGKSFDMSANGVSFVNVIIDDLGIPFSIGDKFTIQFTATPDPLVDPAPAVDPEDCGCVVPGTNDTLPFPTISIHSDWMFSPAQTKKFVGMGQLYTNLLRYNYIDTDMSPAVNAFRGWKVHLAHRIGGLIRGDSLQIDTSLGTLPDTAYKLLLKRSENLNSRWISALRVQLVQAGKRVNNNGNYIPVGMGDDWIFRLETYNPQHPMIEYYELDTSDEYMTFNALQKENTSLEWKRYIKHAQLATMTTPFVVTGVQNLLNVIFGYVDRLDELGFKTDGEATVIDESTGRSIDWQLEVEKLVDLIYTGFGPGDGFVLNPFMSALRVDTPIGLLSRYSESQFIDKTAAQAAFDVNGSVIPLNNLFVVRTDDSSATYSDTPIFSAHVFNDEFEHVIVFNTRLSNEIGAANIFVPFLGANITTATLSYTRQADVDRKPAFAGFVLNGHDVTRNVTSSVDAIANYYDATKTFNEQATAKHALSLLGFSSKPYFSSIGISDATQFNFWRGLIQSKGTNTSIDAFINYRKFTDAAVDEYWAYKVAEYGDARLKTLPEIKIEQNDCRQSFTQLQFYDSSDTTVSAISQFIQIEKDNDARWFSIDDLGTGLSFDAEQVSVQVVAPAVGYYSINTIFHNGDEGAPVVFKNNVKTSDAVMVNANLLKVLVPGTFTVVGYTWANPVKQSPVKLFDYKANTLVKQIALWHPAIGIHAYEPLEIINTISKTDPALYNYTTQTTNNRNFTKLKPWGKKEVGTVWWDTENLSYIPYYDATIFPNRNERNARWGSLAEWATIDLYEWAESDVPPSEYDALAANEEGRADLDPSQRASGKAAKKSYYKRDRAISIRPIAWSKAGVGDSAAHPAFGPAFSTKIFSAGGTLFADAGRTNTINLVEDRHFGAWLTNKPVGEVIITDQIVYDLGSTTALGSPLTTDIDVAEIEGGRFGQRIGLINLSDRVGTDGRVYLRMFDDFGFAQEVDITDWNGTATDVREILFSDFGLKIVCAGSMTANQIASAWGDVYIREGVRVTELITLPDSIFVNDESDADYLTHEYGWKTWDVPTQNDLDEDLAVPRNTWQPYLGDVVSVAPSAAVVKAMADADLVLKSGIVIKRYETTWGDWSEMKAAKVEKISDGLTPVFFARTYIESDEIFDQNRLSIYANGIQLNPQSYVISGDVGQEVVNIVNILPEGTTVLLIYRAYQPTSTELGFDPSVKDDPAVLTQYKADYQYTKVDVRNDAGVVTTAKYYFWVQDKTVADKSMSLVQAKSILTNGPSQFMMFARIHNGVYDSCAIAGLNMLVTNNDTYKLRFTRDHTLRDHPEQLNLKNTHTEWALIRRSQSAKIPKTLWDHLTNAASAMDAGGNPLPSKARIDYDERNGTRSRFGFKPGQIFADTQLVRESIKNTILNTALRIKIGTSSIPDYITALNFNESDEWFSTNESAKATMDLIWSTARPRQINEIFFEVLEDALANNYEFSDIFKTSLISVYSTTKINEQVEGEIQDGQY